MLSLLHAAAWLHEDMFSFLFNILNTVDDSRQVVGDINPDLQNSKGLGKFGQMGILASVLEPASMHNAVHITYARVMGG